MHTLFTRPLPKKAWEKSDLPNRNLHLQQKRTSPKDDLPLVTILYIP